MNKSEIVRRVAETGIGKDAAMAAVNETFVAIGDALVGRDTVAIPGFGRFSSTVRAARAGRNPATGDPIQVAAARVARFKPAAALAKRLAV